MHRYLIIKTSALGDVAQTLAVAQYLKARHWPCQVDWIAEGPAVPLIECHPDVDRAIPIFTKLWRKTLWRRSTLRDLSRAVRALREVTYDASFDLQGNFKSGIINCLTRSGAKSGFARAQLREGLNALTTNRRYSCEVLPIPKRYLQLVQMHFRDAEPFVPKPVQLEVTDEERREVEALAGEGTAKGLLICPFSAWPSKRLSERALVELADLLTRRYDHPVWVANQGEVERVIVKRVVAKVGGRLSALPPLSIPQLQYFMRRALGVIGTDSLPLHLAASAGVPAFGLFGPSHPKGYAPDGEDYGGPGSSHLWRACQRYPEGELRCSSMRACTESCLPGLDANALDSIWAFMSAIGAERSRSP